MHGFTVKIAKMVEHFGGYVPNPYTQEDLLNSLESLLRRKTMAVIKEKTREEIDRVLGTDLCMCGKCMNCQQRQYLE